MHLIGISVSGSSAITLRRVSPRTSLRRYEWDFNVGDYTSPLGINTQGIVPTGAIGIFIRTESSLAIIFEPSFIKLIIQIQIFIVHSRKMRIYGRVWWAKKDRRHHTPNDV